MFPERLRPNILTLSLALNLLLCQTPLFYANELINSTSLTPNTLATTGNITILHEVHEEGFSTKKDKPLHPEILPLKPVKKKPYTLLEKSSTTYEKPKSIKDLELHPVTFDFNLGDLEDLEHEAYKKKDLSAEEKLLLRDSTNIEEGVSTITYTDVLKSPDLDSLQDDLNVQIDFVATTIPSTISSTAGSSTTTTTTTAATTHSSTTPGSYVVTVSPHIFKILKTKTIKKGRELLKHDDLHKGLNNHNSLDHYLTPPDNAEEQHNTTAESHQKANIFQILTNLFDHFYWQPSDIRNKVSTGCGLELQAYLTALHGNYNWAQRAYDSSGRYRGQLFFGNNKWLGQKQNCYELKHQLDPEERKHFEFEFYVALIAFNLSLPENLQLHLQIGECLPKSCTALDVQHILEMDPHIQMLITLNASQLAQVKMLNVRTVPGIYSYWRELRFQILASFLLTLILLVLVATWFQAKLTKGQLDTAPIAVISGSNIEAQVIHHHIASDNGKTFELYQMSNLNENNNVLDAETEVNGKKPSPSQSQHNTAHNVNGNGNGCSHQVQDVEYRIESISNAGTFETKQPLGLHEQLLLCFAFQTNASSIMSIDPQKETQTSCVHGLRVISVLWTIMVHTYLQMFKIGENRFRRIMVERSLWYQIIGNASFSVDTFFFISGFLVTLLYLKSMKKDTEDATKYIKKGFIDTVVLVVYRYIRLTPAYLFVIFFYEFAMRQILDSSVFQTIYLPHTCTKYWWRNILYINNFYPLSEICMIWSWYMANDMQFYIMATVLLILSSRHFKTTVLTICAFLVSSWGIAGVISLHYHYTHKVTKPFESFDFLYDKPWQRVGPYIMGMLTGYIIFKVRSPPKISQLLNNLLWFFSLGLIMLIIFGVWQGELNEITTAFYVSIGHTAFGLGLVGIVLSCCWNLSPTINRILSYRCLLPLSRLTYCTYLIHPVIMLITAYRMDGTTHLSNVFILIVFLGNAVVSFMVAFFISVVFEAPVIRLLKIIFRKQ